MIQKWWIILQPLKEFKEAEEKLNLHFLISYMVAIWSFTSLHQYNDALA